MIKSFSRFLLAVAIGLPGLAAADSLVICRLQPNVSAAAVAKKYAIVLRDSTPKAPFALFSVANSATAAKVEAAMGKDPLNIAWAEDDATVSAPEGLQRGTVQKGGGLPAVGDRHKLQEINKNLLVQVSWNATLAASPGRSVRLAILDTGLSAKQAALWAKVDASMNAIESGQPAVDTPRRTDSNRNARFDEATGHGTMVAGIADQVAPNVRFVIARIADSDGNATAWTLIKGLAFAVTSGAEVANVSLGTLSQVPALTDVMDWCEEKHLFVVAAIGNDNVRAACYPARISKVICVGGLEPDNAKASFSNWEGKCNVSAPATGFASQFWDGSVAVWSGTSFSTPMVSAAIADCLRRGATPTFNSLRKAFEKSGNNLDPSNPKYKGQLGTLLNIARLDQTLRKP